MLVCSFLFRWEMASMNYQLLSGNDFYRAAERGNSLLIDLRSSDDYIRWHMKGAINKNYDTIDEWSKQLDRSIPVLVYCSRGNVSILAARFLSARGFRVGSLIGGIENAGKWR